MRALDVPPRLSCRSMVSFESLNGMYFWFTAFSFEESIEMTFPSVNRLLLIYPVSLAIIPSDFDSLSFSLPAKSTKDILPYLLYTWFCSLSSYSLIRYTVRTECDRDESLLSSWLPECLFLIPSCKTATRSWMLVHSTTIKSSTKKPFFAFHLAWRMPDDGFNKSRNYSL